MCHLPGGTVAVGSRKYANAPRTRTCAMWTFVGTLGLRLPLSARFDPEEYDLLANAQTSTASATASASAPASVSPSATPSTFPSSGGDIDCDQVQGPIPVPPGDPNNLD